MTRMKILILNGSPKVNGNVDQLVGAFAEGLADAGHTVWRKDVGRMHINGCLGCMYCRGEGAGTCIQQDDMQDIYPLIDQMDMLVYASPVFYRGLLGQLVSAITRFYCKSPRPALRSAMILSSGGPDMYDGIRLQYDGLVRYFKMEDLGFKAFCGYQTQAAKQELYAFGASITAG